MLCGQVTVRIAAGQLPGLITSQSVSLDSLPECHLLSQSPGLVIFHLGSWTYLPHSPNLLELCFLPDKACLSSLGKEGNPAMSPSFVRRECFLL